MMRRTPLRRRTALRTQAPLVPVSARRRAENRARKAMAGRRYGPERPLCVFPGPPHWADAFHEPLTRARGGAVTGEANTLPMCNEHNGLLSSLPDSELGWAYEAGLLKHSWGAGAGVCPRHGDSLVPADDGLECLLEGCGYEVRP